MILSGAQPPPVPIPQPPNGAANHPQANFAAAYQAAVRQKLAQAGVVPGVTAQAALNGAVAGQPLGQPHAPHAPGVVPPSSDAIKNAIEMGQSAKGFPLKLPQARKQSQAGLGTSGAPSLPMGQPSTTGQTNHNPVPHPSTTPVSSVGPQSRPMGVPTIPLPNGNQAAANVANFQGQNPQMLANPHFAAAVAQNPSAPMIPGSVARPASAAQNHPPSGQMQPPQAGRVPQQVAQSGLVQHPQHSANPQLAAYSHGQPPQPRQPQGQPGGGQPAQFFAGLPPAFQNQVFLQKTQFSQLPPAEKQAWLDKWTYPQLKNHPDWPSKTDDEKAAMILHIKAIQNYQQRVAYAHNMQRMVGQAGGAQVGQGMMANGMMANGMMANGMMANGMMANGMMANGMMGRMQGANPMAGMAGMPGTGMSGVPGMMQNMGGMPLQNGLPGQLPPQ